MDSLIRMPPIANTWTESFRVHTYETDQHGVASMQTLCNYFQEAAGQHARVYGVSIDALKAHNLTWVLARLRVQVDTYPIQGEEILLETWPSGMQGLFATRDFLILGAAHPDGTRRCLARGISAWLILDMHRKRPVRVAPYLREVVPPQRPRALDAPFAKLKPPTAVDGEYPFRVRYSDLDVNQHVNNVRYAEWAIESVPEDILHTCHLRSLELQFQAEAVYGDTVVVQTQRTASDTMPTFIHHLVHQRDRRPVAVARTGWLAR